MKKIKYEPPKIVILGSHQPVHKSKEVTHGWSTCENGPGDTTLCGHGTGGAAWLCGPGAVADGGCSAGGDPNPIS
jgi:hypothetical protein